MSGKLFSFLHALSCGKRTSQTDCAKKKPNEAEIAQSVEKSQKIWELDIGDIWSLADDNDFIVAMCGWIQRKCGYGSNIAALNPAERVFYITQTCEGEVNNGGFSQFFLNTDGDYTHELVRAFTEIGALKTAKICEDLLEALGGPLPEDYEARQALFCAWGDEADKAAAMDEADSAFYRYEDDLNALNRAYILQHKADFT